MNSSAFDEASTETNGNYPTVSPSVRRIRTLKRRKEHERENSNKTQVRQVLPFSFIIGFVNIVVDFVLIACMFEVLIRRKLSF